MNLTLQEVQLLRKWSCYKENWTPEDVDLRAKISAELKRLTRETFFGTVRVKP